MSSRPTWQLGLRLLRQPISSTRIPAKNAWQQCRSFQISVPRSAAKSTKTAAASFSYNGTRTLGLALLAGAGIFSASYALSRQYRISLDAPATSESLQPLDLPEFRLSEIRKHDGHSEQPWIIHGNKVYDITDWVPAHPGGDVILRAAGGPVDRYWDIFAIHKSQYVYDILAQYLIGHVHPSDLTADGTRLAQNDEIEDPFSDDPKRHADLITRTMKPRNAETPEDALTEHFLTPNDLFYVRNHMWVPSVGTGEGADLDPEQHILTIELADGLTKSYTLQDLKERFPHRSVTAVLQCSGNRRSHMSAGSGRKANGLPWSAGAISNAKWEGVLLADVLKDAGFDPATREDDSETKHVHFSAMEAYGASIPIRKATDPVGDVLLAWGMNGQPLPRDHGFPLRSIVPGNVAARSVKWLNRITLSDEESPSQWQRKDYKCFGPNETAVDWDAAPAIQEMPVQSAITGIKVSDSADDKEGRPVTLTGYAISGGGRAVVRVDVSLDGGLTWSQARLINDCATNPEACSGSAQWSWKRWRFEGLADLNVAAAAGVSGESHNVSGLGKKCTTFVCKATDEVYNTQPENHASTWNVRGNLATAWHRVRVCADCMGGVEKKGQEVPL